MGRKGGFLAAVKKILSCESKANREKLYNQKHRTSEKLLAKPTTVEVESYSAENSVVICTSNSSSRQEVKLTEADNEHNRHAYSVAIATAVAAEAAVAAAHAAAEVVRLTAVAQNVGQTKEEIASTKIQTAFRGYMARRVFRALKGLVRLKSFIEGQSIKRQATTTLKCMQTLARFQFEIRARRIKMSEENSAIQRQIQQKHDKEIEKMRESTGGNWDDSMLSKEQIEANIQTRKDASMKRERALAYAYSHQQTWRSTSIPGNHTFMNPNNPHWGWSWFERWMTARPFDKEQSTDHASIKSSRSFSARGDSKIQSPSGQKRSQPPSRQSPSTPNSKVTSRAWPSSSRGTIGTDEDSKSMNSVQSIRCHRRHSIAGSSVPDDESLASSPAAPGYMTPTESARAKARLPSPLGLAGTPDKVSGGSAKKRLSFSGSPALRRHSGPTKID